MPTLRLHQLPARKDGRFPIAIVWREDEGGSETNVEGLSATGLDDPTRKELRWYFEDYLDQLYDLPTRLRAAWLEERMIDLGEALFRDLFPATEGARDLWARIQNRLADTRIEIATSVPEATAITWELLQDPDAGTPLALNAHEFVRVPSGGGDHPHQIELRNGEKLRILLAICRPGALKSSE